MDSEASHHLNRRDKQWNRRNNNFESHNTHHKLLPGSIDALENICDLSLILLMNRNLSDKRLLLELD